MAKHYDKNFAPIDFIYKIKNYLSEEKCNLFVDFYNEYKDFAKNDDLNIDKILVNLRKTRDKDDEELKRAEKVFETICCVLYIGGLRYLRVLPCILKDLGVSWLSHHIRNPHRFSEKLGRKGGLIYVIFLETLDVDLLFKYKNKKIKIKKGTLVIFPNHISYLSNIFSLPNSLILFNHINYHT